MINNSPLSKELQEKLAHQLLCPWLVVSQYHQKENNISDMRCLCERENKKIDKVEE
jgi:hypothetical protein